LNKSKREKNCVVHYWGGQPNVRTSRFDWHHSILDKCQKQGWRSVVIFSSPLQNEEIKKALAESKIQCLYIKRPKRQYDLRCIRESYRMFKNTGCTIAHFHCVHASPIIGAALAGVPVRIWSNHSSEYNDDGKSMSWIHKFGLSIRVTCTLAHKVLPVSEGIGRELLRYGVPEDKMTVAPIPIDPARYVARPEARSKIRNSLGFTGRELIVCNVGQAIYRKGWDILIRSFAQVAQKIPQIHLILIGAIANKDDGSSDQYQKSLLKLVEEFGIQDRIHFLGIRYDIADILSASDIFAFPTRAEGMPLAILEAMAADLPCIATSVGGIPEVIKDGENGLLVESEDENAFASGLMSLATDQTLRSRLGGNAQKSLEAFSLAYQTKNILNIYNELLTL